MSNLNDFSKTTPKLETVDTESIPAGVEPGLKETSFYDPVNFSFPAGTHICKV